MMTCSVLLTRARGSVSATQLGLERFARLAILRPQARPDRIAIKGTSSAGASASDSGRHCNPGLCEYTLREGLTIRYSFVDCNAYAFIFLLYQLEKPGRRHPTRNPERVSIRRLRLSLTAGIYFAPRARWATRINLRAV